MSGVCIFAHASGIAKMMQRTSAGATPGYALAEIPPL